VWAFRQLSKRFFFEKKNQKTFVRLMRKNPIPPHQTYKSLFASFSSEKEDPKPY
jgi:hypothetical protein